MLVKKYFTFHEGRTTRHSMQEIMEKLSVQEAKDRLGEVIQTATDDGKQFTVTSEAGNVVILPQETYENILVTLELLSTPGLMDNLDFSNCLDAEDKIEHLPHATNH